MTNLYSYVYRQNAINAILPTQGYTFPSPLLLHPLLQAELMGNIFQGSTCSFIHYLSFVASEIMLRVLLVGKGFLSLKGFFLQALIVYYPAKYENAILLCH